MKHDRYTLATIIILVWVVLCVIFFSGCRSFSSDWLNEDYMRTNPDFEMQRKYNGYPVQCSPILSPYRIGPIPGTQREWQYWHMVNHKLGKWLEMPRHDY